MNQPAKKQFLQWRSPRFGKTNPERMTNPVWTWLIETKLNGYQATKEMEGPSPFDAGPTWCFDRFGQSTTTLQDGRTVLIAGEHEDHYDPDFQIYNDVVIRSPEGGIEILGYPEADFPPTDFHSATLIGGEIVMVGNLGYGERRRYGETQIAVLNLATLAMRTFFTNNGPGWIHSQKAELTPDAGGIIISGGTLDRGGDERGLVENLDDWRLNLRDWTWARLTSRNWERREISRNDGAFNHLFEMRQAVFSEQYNLKLPEILSSTTPPDFDRTCLAELYRPAMPHTPVERDPFNDKDYNVYRITIEDVVVRYVEEMGTIQMTVEGDLSRSMADALAEDVRVKMERLEGCPCSVRNL